MRRFIWLPLLLACLSAPLQARGYSHESTEEYPSLCLGLDQSIAWYQAHVEDDADLIFRSAVQGTFTPALGISFSKGAFYGMVPVSFVSQSKDFGGKHLKPLMEAGCGCKWELYLGAHAALMFSASFNYGWYFSHDQGNFVSFTLGTGPSYRIPLSKGNRLEISVPLRLDWRDDVMAPSIGVGVAYFHDWRL